MRRRRRRLAGSGPSCERVAAGGSPPSEPIFCSYDVIVPLYKHLAMDGSLSPLRLYETACVFNKHSIFFYMHINILAMLYITQQTIDYKMGLLTSSASKLAVDPFRPS